MMKKKPTIALMYDFDKTLCDQDMQNYTFIPNLGMTSHEFWGEVEQFRKKNYMEGILGYTYYTMYKCQEKGIPFTEALEDMKKKAAAGRDATKDMVARFGRSSRLGERSRGVLDAGATSCCIILTSMADAADDLLK